MRAVLKSLLTKLNTAISLRGKVQHGSGVKCNFCCRFTDKTKIGNNCHFNGMHIFVHRLSIEAENIFIS